MTTRTDIEPTFAEIQAFAGRVTADTSAWMVTTMAMIGDRLGLWQRFAGGRALTVGELAAEAGISQRYALEWLSSMTAQGYLLHDPDPTGGCFTLPAAAVPVLAADSPVYFGGLHQALFGLTAVLGPVVEAFRHGRGVPMEAYGDDWWQGLERFTAGAFDHLLPQAWLPAMPEVEAKLVAGAAVADVGCGRGRALIALAKAYPRSRFTGFDMHPESVEAARAAAADAGVADRVRFHCADVVGGLPGDYDVITTFDVIHDAADPQGLLRAIRAALRPDGRYVCVDINIGPSLADNAGPLGAYFYGISVLYCMSTSLAQGGAGLGTCGFDEATARRMCAGAGFGELRRVEIENPFNNLYEVRR
jgi:2-polyprenyl-3-methyl-5-hydroxy-6-metoxy-1,4-benzoquinol methylase